MKKSLLTLVSILLVAAFVLAACGTPAEVTEEPKATVAPAQPAATEAPKATEAPAAAPIEVTLWHTYGTGSVEEVAMTAALAEAAKDLPQYKINVLQVPFADVFTKYSADVAAGGGPDMFIAPNDSLGDQARGSLIADMTEMLNGKLGDYSKLGVEGMTLNGKIYGVPESMKALAFWYDKSKLPAAPKTTDELKKLMEGGTAISISYGCYHQYGFYGAFGGKIFDDKWKVIADQGTGVTDAMTYLNDLYQISKKNSWPKTDSDGLAPFVEGKVVGITNGNWAMGDYKKALGANLAVAPLPAGPGGPATPMFGVDGYYFNPNSANKDAALEVALYMTSPKIQKIMMDQAGHAPVNTKVEVTDPLMKDLLVAFNAGVTFRPQVPELGKYWSNFCGTDQVFEKGTTPAQWVTDATAASNK
jgi:arabinogalactan oligomer/maltooligosaccharide transport system substrate-binding protein